MSRSQRFNLISIVIPVFNEEKTLRPLIESLDSVRWPLPIEWVFVDDCSTDGSLPLLEELAARYPQIVIIQKDTNEGKSGAIKTGFQAARGDVIVIQDADLEYHPRELPALIAPILNDTADVVYGSRFKMSGLQVHRTFHRYINRFLTLLSNIASGIYLTDMETCYKVFRAEVIKSFHLEATRFGFEPEVTAYIAKFPLRIYELPISYFPRTVLMGKKIRWTDGFAALWYILRCNYMISSRDCLTPEAQTALAEGRLFDPPASPSSKRAA